MKRLVILLAVVAALFALARPADAALSSGLPGGPVGAPVLSVLR